MPFLSDNTSSGKALSLKHRCSLLEALCLRTRGLHLPVYMRFASALLDTLIASVHYHRCCCWCQAVDTHMHLQDTAENVLGPVAQVIVSKSDSHTGEIHGRQAGGIRPQVDQVSLRCLLRQDPPGIPCWLLPGAPSVTQCFHLLLGGQIICCTSVPAINTVRRSAAASELFLLMKQPLCTLTINTAAPYW